MIKYALIAVACLAPLLFLCWLNYQKAKQKLLERIKSMKAAELPPFSKLMLVHLKQKHPVLDIYNVDDFAPVIEKFLKQTLGFQSIDAADPASAVIAAGAFMGSYLEATHNATWQDTSRGPMLSFSMNATAITLYPLEKAAKFSDNGETGDLQAYLSKPHLYANR